MNQYKFVLKQSYNMKYQYSMSIDIPILMYVIQELWLLRVIM